MSNPIGIPFSCPTSEEKNGKTVAIEFLSKLWAFFIVFSLNGKLLLKASSWIAHAGLTSINVLAISEANNSVSLSRSSKLYANNVHTIVDSYNLLNPLAIWSLKSSASILFCAKILSRFISPLSIATSLSASSSLIVLFKSVCDELSLTGEINTDVFTSPNVYILLKNSGNVHILGIFATIILLAYLVLVDTISTWFIFEKSIPAGAIKSLILLAFFPRTPFGVSTTFWFSSTFLFFI